MCTLVTSCIVLMRLCLVDLMAVLNTGGATMSSQAWLRFQSTAVQRHCRHDNVTESRNARSKWLPCDAHRAANWLKMATRRALEGIKMFEGPTGFRYEILDLFCICVRLQVCWHILVLCCFALLEKPADINLNSRIFLVGLPQTPLEANVLASVIFISHIPIFSVTYHNLW